MDTKIIAQYIEDQIDTGVSEIILPVEMQIDKEMEYWFHIYLRTFGWYGDQYHGVWVLNKRQ